MSKFILTLCGLPASGKSKLADAIQKALDYNVEIVRTDDWRDDAYYTDWKPEKEKPVREAALVEVKKFVAEGKSVIHDDTNYYTSMRHELYEIAYENECGFSIIHVATPLATAIRWNTEREDSQISDSVIVDISGRFDSPGRRYLWDRADLEVDMENQDLSSIVSEIVEILRQLQPVAPSQPSTITSNEFDTIDTETRQIVSKFLAENPILRGNREVSDVRKTVLREVNQGRIPAEGVGDVLRGKLSELL